MEAKKERKKERKKETVKKNCKKIRYVNMEAKKERKKERKNCVWKGKRNFNRRNQAKIRKRENI